MDYNKNIEEIYLKLYDKLYDCSKKGHKLLVMGCFH